MATDLAEIVGGAVALNLLFDLPLLVGAVITTAVSTALLLVQDRRSQQTFERVITGMLAVVTVGFLAGLFFSPPDPAAAVGRTGAAPRRHRERAAGRRHARCDRDAARDLPAFGADPRPARRGRCRLRPAGAQSDQAGCDLGDDDRRQRQHRHAAARRQHAVRLATSTACRLPTQGIADRSVPPSPPCSPLALLASGLASTSVGGYAGAVIMDGLLKRRVPISDAPAAHRDTGVDLARHRASSRPGC